MKLRLVTDEWTPVPAVLSVDPGGTTGWAIWTEGGEPAFGQQPGQLPFAEQAWAVLTEYEPEVVCEAYIIGAGTVSKTRQYEPLELIGTLRWMTHKLGLSFKLQTPAQAKAFATDEKLKAVGWYNATKGGHANDAARHLLTYLVTVKKDQALLNKLLENLG